MQEIDLLRDSARIFVFYSGTGGKAAETTDAHPVAVAPAAEPQE